MLKLYNTATRTLTEFVPQDPQRVKIYTCGPTVYSTPHIGNFTAYTYWDLLLRTLKLNHFQPYRVMNFTDVGHLTSDADDGEDKMEKGARKEGKTVWEIAEFYIEQFKADFFELALLEPDCWARATDYIEASKHLVQSLISHGYTYETTDGVYFDTSKFPAYAEFAKLDLEHLKAGARVEYSDEKRNPADFAVWKFIQPGETHAMRWDFLGRPGYPGWHLECSSIIHATLGEPIDIHTGGIDHIPVHHTNEIAQTYGAFNQVLANFWLHCNHITIAGEKISKSLGNTITLADIKARGFSPFDFKLWLYQGHYRSARNFTWEDLTAAKQRRLNWRNAVARLYQHGAAPVSVSSSNFAEQITAELNNDLNSAAAFALIDAHLDQLTLADWQFLETAFALQLMPQDVTAQLAPQIQARNAARQSKDYASADRIRDQLAEAGYTLLDAQDQTFWQLKN